MPRFDWIHTEAATVKWARNLAEALRKELKQQGHVASGRLLDSIGLGDLDTRGGKVKQTIKAFGRGEKLDKRQENAVVSINQLLRWMTNKNKTAISSKKFVWSTIKEKRRIAYAIKRAIEKEGIPTANSYNFSNNGRRTGWISLPFKRSKIEVNKKVIPAITKDVVESISRILERLASRYPNMKILK